MGVLAALREGPAPCLDVLKGLVGKFTGGTKNDTDRTLALNEWELGFLFEGGHDEG